MSATELVEEMLALETQLLHGDYRDDASLADSLLACEFREVHAGGGLSTRAEVLAWLRSKDPEARWAFADFEVQVLAADLRLCTYHARQVAPRLSTGRGARHVSLWVRQTDAQSWQLHYHQATRLA